MPKAVNLVVLAVLGVYAGISVVALSALPVVHHGVGYSAELKQSFAKPGYATALGGFFENDPMLGVISRLGLHGTVLTLAQYYVGLLAATILFIATNAGHDRDLAAVVVAVRAPPAAAALLAAALPLPHAVVHAHLLLAAREHADHLRQHRSARQPLLVRRDALVHDRARGDREAARRATPTASAPTGSPWGVRIRGARDPDDRRDRRDRHVRRLGGRDGAAHRGALRRHPLDDRRHGRLLLLPQAPGPRPAQALPHRAPRAPAGLRGARLPDGARADLRRRRQRVAL